MSNQMTYEEIVEIWLRDFIDSMDQDGLRPGNRSGDAPPGVKIIFDGFGYNEETNTEDDENTLTFAVFVHRDSLSGQFPEHEETPWALVHRPKEEVWISAIYKLSEDEVTILPFEESDSTELEPEFVYKLIGDIHEEYYS
jgi:hypothetical protein